MKTTYQYSNKNIKFNVFEPKNNITNLILKKRFLLRADGSDEALCFIYFFNTLKPCTVMCEIIGGEKRRRQNKFS